MKKTLILAAAVLMFASTAFAGTTVDLSFDSGKQGLTLYAGKVSGDAAKDGDAAQKNIGKTSTGVGVGCITSTLGYAVVTQHKNGIKAYASSHDSTAVYMADAVKGTVFLPKPTAIGTADFVKSGSKWTSM